MDQDYERRLLRQIVIQNENTMPCVSSRWSPLPVLARSGGAGGEVGLGVWLATGLLPSAKEGGAVQVKNTSSPRTPS